MAEALFAKALPSASVQSAGTHALVGRPADPMAVDIMARLGLDISGHRGQAITASLVRSADIIFVMEAAHRSFLAEGFQSARGKIFRLGEYNGGDIADPYRGTPDDFAAALEQIQRGVDVWLERITKLT